MKAWREHNSRPYVRANKKKYKLVKKERKDYFISEFKSPSNLIENLITRFYVVHTGLSIEQLQQIQSQERAV